MFLIMLLCGFLSERNQQLNAPLSSLTGVDCNNIPSSTPVFNKLSKPQCQILLLSDWYTYSQLCCTFLFPTPWGRLLGEQTEGAWSSPGDQDKGPQKGLQTPLSDKASSALANVTLLHFTSSFVQTHSSPFPTITRSLPLL